MPLKRVFAMVVALCIMTCACAKPQADVQDAAEEGARVQTESGGEAPPPVREAPSAAEPDEAGQETENPGVDPAFTAEEIEEIRLSIPYPGIGYRSMGKTLVSQNSDEITKELAAFIHQVLLFTRPGKSFSSPMEEAAQPFLIRSSFYNTEDVRDALRELGPDQAEYILKTLGGADGRICAKEHVEETARYLFGDGAVLDHSLLEGSDGSFIRYFGDIGFYGGAAFGMPGFLEPVIVSLEEEENRYELEVAFPLLNGEDNGYRHDEQLITQDDYEELMRFCREEAEHHSITLVRRNDGSLIYYSHQLP